MRWFPFIRKKYESELGWEYISDNIKKNTSKPSFKLSIEEVLDSSIYEARIVKNSFIIGHGRGSLIWGVVSMFPKLKGKVEEKDGKTTVSVTVRAPAAGIFSILLFFLLLICNAIVLLFKNKIGSMIGPLIFGCFVYGSIISRFNKEFQAYLEIVEKSLT